MTPGVETTTGPLGQGFANAVGMALAEKLLAAEFNRAGHADRRPPHLRVPRRRLPDGRHLARGLRRWPAPGSSNKLIAIYDDNGISIDGEVTPWFIDDTPQRFAAYGWNVIGPIDGHDVDAVDRAIAAPRAAPTSRR